MASNRYLWGTALLVAPSTMLTVRYISGRGLLPVTSIFAVPTVVWIGGLLLRRRRAETARSLGCLAAGLGVVVILWVVVAVMALTAVGRGLE